MNQPEVDYSSMANLLMNQNDRRASLIRKTELSVDLFDGTNWYPIAWDECSTGKEIFDWVFQLLEKEWVTKDQIGYFLVAVFEKFPDLNPRR